MDGQQNNNPSTMYRKFELPAILVIAVCAIVVMVHWPALSARALSFDDGQYLTNNLLVQNPSMASAKRFLVEVLKPSTVKGYYQPLSMISLMLDYEVGGRGDNLMPFHRTSLVLHAANTALIIVLLYILFEQPWVAAIVGLLFGIHPLTVEPIPWIGERKTLLAAFFALWCLIFYVRYTRTKNRKSYIACLATYILALMSKPTSVPLPVLMLLMDYWPLQRTDLKLQNIKNFVFEKWPFFAFTIVSAVVTYVSQTRTAFTTLPTQYRHGVVPMILCHNIVFYLYKIIWPVNLSSHYPYPAPMSFSNPVILAATIGTFVLIALLLISLRWTRAAMTGWLVFFVGLFPTMGIIGFNDTIASDKFAYLPSVGLLMILAAFLKWLWNVSDIGKFTRQSIGLAIIVLAMIRAETIATRQYLVHWQDSMSLCKHILKLAPNDASSYNLIGFTLQSEGKYDDAANCYRQAILFNPNEADAYNNLSVILISQGKTNEAIDCLNKSLQINPNSAETYNNLSVLFKLQGKFKEAVDCLHRALQINPDYADGLSNLGIVLGMQGKSEEAIACYRKAIELKPDDAKVYNNLAWLLVTDPNPKIRNPAQAVEFAERAVELTRHQSAVILNTLAETYAAAGRFDKAIITAQETLAIASAAQNKELTDHVRKQLELYKQSKR